MTDLTGTALQAVARGDARAMPLAFLCGVLASAGPCAATRLLALTAIAARSTARATWALTASYVAGLAAAYGVFAMGGSLLWRALAYSDYAYAAMAACMMAGGLGALLRDPACSGDGSKPGPCRSFAGTFLIGAASAMTMSPCCTPMLAGAVAYSANTGPLFAAGTVSAFAFGHSVSLFAAARGVRLMSLISWQRTVPVMQVISGSLMVALAGFYGVLA